MKDENESEAAFLARIYSRVYRYGVFACEHAIHELLAADVASDPGMCKPDGVTCPLPALRLHNMPTQVVPMRSWWSEETFMDRDQTDPMELIEV